MNRHISAKIFAATVGIFSLVLLLQWLFISGSFNQLYEKSLISSMKAELHNAVRNYSGHMASENQKPLSDYALQTGSPILILTENGRIIPCDCTDALRTMEVKLSTGGTAIVPIGYLYDIYGPNAPYIGSGRRLDVELVRLGSSNFYEPLSITPETQVFRNRTGIKAFSSQDVLSFSQVTVLGTSNLRQQPSLTTSRAELIFSALKSGLAAGESPGSYLPQLCANDMAYDGYEYHFLFSKVAVDDTVYYFVTAQRIVVTGFERTYLNHVFLSVYGIIGLILLVAAFFLSRSVSRPLMELNKTAQLIASMDFTQRLSTKRKDEFGQLAENINTMADNLHTTMTALTETNQKLAYTSSLAQANEARMKKLLSELAHEFKTPLGIISSYMEAIELGLAKDPEQYFRIIDEEITDLTFMVNEAIELARLQSGSWKIEPSNHNLCDILEGVRQKFSDRLAAQDYTFEVESCDLVVRCDAHRIDQVICNFISNAVKYSDMRHIIRLYVTSSGSTAIVHVENSGRLPDGDTTRIWQRNYGEATFSHSLLPSQGIGLDIVRSILDAHDSQYDVSEAGGFVTFSFTLQIM